MAEWFEDESFWIEMYPFMFPEKRFAEAGEQVEKVLALLGVERGAVLDLCCGPGRHSVELAHRGFRVTGVDRTAFLLDKAREKARATGLQIEWVQEDMRRFVRPESFDLVLSLFTSFGYFDDQGQDLQVLKNIHAGLRPGGACLIDVVGKEQLAARFTPTTSSQLDDGTLLIQRHEIFAGWTRIRNEWLVIREGRARSFKFHHTLYSGQELKDLLLQAGFCKVDIYGDLEGNPYGPGGWRLVAAAWKAG